MSNLRSSADTLSLVCCYTQNTPRGVDILPGAAGNPGLMVVLSQRMGSGTDVPRESNQSKEHMMSRDNNATFSLASRRSILSIGSAGSILSIGSVGSILSIGSAGSILSIGSVGSILSIGSAGSILSILSAGRRLSILQQRRQPGRPV